MTHSSTDPLHGMTLEAIVNALVARFGWEELAKRININCFKSDPSVKSSLKFLRRTPWARKEVEDLYLDSLEEMVTQKEIPADSPWANWQSKKGQE
ncbi:MAG TPA: VF530 family protein [Buttiauxella sp.]|uniref:VF530 family protein n=1 Tax=Buttiauxella sp. TaxID=1972222 RepID=UPI002B484434|nr:VF530 family protein [Buttiauxella sp.]HKM96044.1 VF530 family protein [Buttiauxella sp.]